MKTIDICPVSPGDIFGRVRNEHRPWTSGSPGCKDCGTNEPCAAQEAANEVLRLSRLINAAADDLSRLQRENLILRGWAGLAHFGEFAIYGGEREPTLAVIHSARSLPPEARESLQKCWDDMRKTIPKLPPCVVMEPGLRLEMLETVKPDIQCL